MEETAIPRSGESFVELMRNPAHPVGARKWLLMGSLTAVFATGPAAMYGLIVVGLSLSIMFPAIFALAIRGLGPLTEEGSGLLIMSIAGGALAAFQGKIGDTWGLHWGFLVTAACALYVLFYALWGCKVTNPVADAPGTAAE